MIPASSLSRVISPSAVTTSTSDGSIENQLKRASQQNEAYLNEAKSLYNSYASVGATSLDEYMKLLQGGVSGLSTDNNFLALQDLAERKVMANRATSGLLRSGATASALDDTLLNFANNYYGARLGQFREGVGIGQTAISSQSNILEKLGGNQTDLASALANIQMQREANDAVIKAAQIEADAAKKAAKKSGKSGLFGSIGGLLGGVGGFLIGGPAGAYIGANVGSGIGSSAAY